AEEYNDNLFLNNANRRSDFVTHASPGLRVSIENPGLRVNAGYFFTAEKYAEQTQLDTFFRTQGLFADTRWQVTPLVALTLGDILTASDSTNAASAQGIATGRTRSVSNTVNPGLTWQITPRTSFQLLVSYTLERFDSVNTRDSDTYRL